MGIIRQFCQKRFQRSPKHTGGFTLIELIVASLIISVVMLVAWSGLISLMNMSSMAEARTQRQIEITQALDFMTDELRTARHVNATDTAQVNGTTDIADLLTSDGFNLNDLGDYGNLSLYLEIPASNDTGTCPNPVEFDRVVYDVRPSTSEWLSPRTLMRFGRIKLDGSFDPCSTPIASDPIADALSDDASNTPTCAGVQTGGAGFYACKDGNRTQLTFQHTLVDTSVVEVESGATSRLQPIQPKTLANAGCQNKSNLRSLASDIPAHLQVVNQLANDVKIYDIDTAGIPQTAETIAANSTWGTNTFETHPWVVTDTADSCLAIYIIDGSENIAILTTQNGIGGVTDPPSASDGDD